MWPQVTPRPLTMQFTMADAYNLNVGKVFGELLEQDREAAPGRLRRPRVAGTGGRRPRAGEDEAPVGDLRGQRVGPVPRVGGPAGHRAGRGAGQAARSTSCASSPCTEDLTTRFRAYIANDDADAVGDAADDEVRGAGPVRRRRPRRPALRRPAVHRPPGEVGAGARGPVRRASRPQDDRRARRHVRLRRPRRTCGRATGPTSASSTPPPSAPAPSAGSATSPPTPNA